MSEWNIVSVRETADQSGQIPFWEVVFEVPAEVMPSGFFPCLFPKMTFENYAAQYGFDPDDVPTLLDAILHEFMLRPLHASGELPMPNPSLMNEDEAREEFLRQVRQIKAEHRGGVVQRLSVFRLAPEIDLLRPIIESTRIDRDAVTDKQWFSDLTRHRHGVKVKRDRFANGKTVEQFAAELHELASQPVKVAGQ